MSIEKTQWTIQDFEKQRPLFRANYVELGLMGLSLWPFCVAFVYWLECQWMKSVIGSDAVMMWSSIGVGAALAFGACTIIVEWTKAIHYNNLRKGDGVLPQCIDLLHRALEDEKVVRAWVQHERDRPSFVRRLKSTVVSAAEGMRVEAYDDELVYRLIDQWVRKQRRSQNVAVIDARLQHVRGAEHTH